MARHVLPITLVMAVSVAACSGGGLTGAPSGSGLSSSARKAQSFQSLHIFRRGKDGAEPYGGLLLVNGMLYGTTAAGGDANDAGTVFTYTASGGYSIVHRFALHKPFGQRAYPDAGVISDPAGNLYGTTTEGGALHHGSVYKLTPNGRVSILHTFIGPEGEFPHAPLLRDANGNLYGVTEAGGNLNDCEGGGCGTVFKIDPRGKISVLYEFQGGVVDGHDPISGLARDRQGNLYGTTLGGGNDDCAGEGCGIVFAIDPKGHETILHRFTNQGADGGHPAGTLLLASDGYLYGTADSGGMNDAGLVFKIDTSGNLTNLYTFTGGADGAAPFGGLAQDAAGNFYGTTEFGGLKACQLNQGCGTVFELDAGGHETVLYSFTGKSDGNYPLAGVTLGAAGSIYGVTWLGGDRKCSNGEGCGVLFQLQH